jgi:hypothetical protein
MILYGLAIALFLFGGLLGISEKMLGIESYWILSVPGSIILFVLGSPDFLLMFQGLRFP